MRLPPYARQAAIHPDKLLGYWIYTGTDAWHKAKQWNTPENADVPGLVLPEGESPESFRWPVKGRNTLIYRTSPIDAEIQMSLARELLRAGASSVIATQSGPLVEFYADG